MNREIIELREVVTKLVPMLAGKGLKVTQRGADAYVQADPITMKPIVVNIPNIPDTATPEFIRAIQGFIDHEVGHVLFTDWSLYGGGGVSGKQLRDPKIKRFIAIHNMLEDTMIEPAMVRMFPGSRKNISDMREHFIAKITRPALASAQTPDEEFNYLIVPALRALAGHEEFDAFMTNEKHWDHPFVKELVSKLSPAFLKKIKTATTTRETLELAREVEAILYPPPPPAPPPPPKPSSDACDDEPQDAQPQESQDGESQDKPDKKADQGDGDGERDRSDNESEDGDQQADSSNEKSEQGDAGESEGSSDGESSSDDDDGKSGKGKSSDKSEQDHDDPQSDDEENAEADGSSDGEKDEAEGQDGDASEEDADDGTSGDEDAQGSQDDDRDEPEDDDTAEEPGSDGNEQDGLEADGEGVAEDDDDGDGEEAEDGAQQNKQGSDEADEDSSDDGETEGVDDGDEEDEDQTGEGDASDDEGDNRLNTDPAGNASDDGDDDGDDDGQSNQQSADGEGGTRLAVQTDDHDAFADSSDEEGGGGVGNGMNKSLFDFKDDAFEKADVSSQIAILVCNEAVDAIQDNDYNVYTREFDRIETLNPPDQIDAAWVPDLEDRTRQMVGRMQKDIERMVAAQSRVIRTPGYRAGRLHAPSLHRMLTNDDRVFFRREEFKSKDTAVTLLCDNSGSMGGSKIFTAMVAAYALAQTLERVNVVSELLGFTTGDFPRRSNVYEEIRAQQNKHGIQFHRITPIMMPIYKTFDERINSTVKKRIAYMANAQQGMGANVDGESLEYAALRLLKRREKRKIILVLSDGQPSGGANVAPHLKRTVEKVSKLGVELVGIGINDASVRRFYPKHTVLNSVEDLPKQIMGELRDILA